MRWAAITYVLMSLLTLLAFGADKRRAMRGCRRIPEASLHLLELLGGFPGAMLGGRLFRHKTRKRRYRFITGAIALLHVAGWLAWLLILPR
ncbi:MAG: DUF1294 domain-containing protein [Phycisphaerales bacterium]|nr:DUF1294 domain-containing protein [Phycisphaerales bacterium]